MYRPAARSLLRSAAHTSFAPAQRTAGRRFASTSPGNARRSWKSSAVRWGIAVAGIYYYNTSPVFAEQPQNNLLNPNLEPYEDSVDASSIEALTSARARRAEKNASVLKSAADAVSSENASTTLIAEEDEIPLQTGSPADLEEEAASEGAFNPETGEINWDCPCLGGMAHGPCGPEFREAFSCFVFSEEEPKGMDCIDKFQNMQECFKLHPEVYKGELEDDEELDAGLEAEKQELVNEIAERRAQQQESVQQRLLEEPAPAASKPPRKSKKSTSEVEQKSFKQGESKPPKPQGKEKAPDREDVFADQDSADEKHSTKPEEDTAIPKAGVVPKAAHDARGSVGVKTTEK